MIEDCPETMHRQYIMLRINVMPPRVETPPPVLYAPCYKKGRSDGGIWGIYTLPKSGQVNFLWGNNDVRTVIEHFIPPQNKFLATPLWLQVAVGSHNVTFTRNQP